MKTNEAVMRRIQEICEQQGKTVCDICLRAGMSPSNIYAFSKGRTKNIKVNTLQRFCEGAEMSMEQFFASELFLDLENEDIN